MLIKITRKLVGIILIILLLLQIAWITKTFASSNPSISVLQGQNNTYTITVIFPQSVPKGNIIDLEVYNSSNQKIWQYFTTNGGISASSTTQNLDPGTYTIDIGLFYPNWSSNYMWYSNLYTLVVPSLSISVPGVVISKDSGSSFTVSTTFSQNIPAGNIIDLELYNLSNQRVWQSTSTSGGVNYTTQIPSLSPGNYNLSVGLFYPNWSSNYAWFGNIYSLNVPFPTPSPSPIPAQTLISNSQAFNAAGIAYSAWKSKYVQTVSPGILRVIRPENNYDTVSEGMGYGMLLSYFANDRTTFSGLFNYVQKYLDLKGLMNWQISSSGSIIGQGSATDADEDIAFALLRADSKWPGNGYGQTAKRMISSMMNTEVQPTNLINPGDNWGQTEVINPSYISPSYYRAFAAFSGDSRWTSVANTTLLWEENASNTNTGLVPDWLNADYSQPSIPWDQYSNDFYYDAVRAPIRLLMDYEWNKTAISGSMLNKENNFVSQIGVQKLVSGYTLSGLPLTNYIDSTFLSAYAAIGQASPNSQFAVDSLNSLIQNNPNNYFGSSLRALALYIIGGAD